MIEFTIPCAAVGKGRPRVTAHGTYTPQKTRDYEQLVRLCFQRSRRKPVTDREKALAVTITAIFRVPESYSEKKKRELVGKPYTKKPDADNLAKAILDALNGMAYPDDAQIVNLKVRKWYGETEMYRFLKSTGRSSVIRTVRCEPQRHSGQDALCAGLVSIWKRGQTGLIY